MLGTGVLSSCCSHRISMPGPSGIVEDGGQLGVT